MQRTAARIQPSVVREIEPFWSSATWVFDDPSVGLIREPFVAGVPEILSRLVRGIPNAQTGFRLLFSDRPFPGYQAQFEWISDEGGGARYREVSPVRGEPAEGWLCPALFHYFDKAPDRLFLRVEAKLGERRMKLKE